MTATAVVEILVLGLQGLLWVATGVAAFVHDDWLARLQALKEWAPLITVLALASAYGLGVIVDRCADTLFWMQDTPRDVPAKVAMMRLTVLHKSEGIAKFLEYQRSRLRIARGMVVNVALGTLSAVVYLAMRGRPGICWVILVGGVALLVTWYAARRIHDAYIRRLRDAYTLLLAET